MTEKNTQLSRFGFSFERGGTHIARTMMLDELKILLSYVNRPDASKNEYVHAIREENCLGKRSGKSRELTYRHLAKLYSLDCTNILFRTLRYFWKRDTDGKPLLALICTYARDPLFQSTAPFILQFSEGSIVSRKALEEFIDAQEIGRFSKATLTSVAQNINSTWTQSGHLHGRARKIRTLAKPTPGSVAYALFLGYLTGARGQALFQTEYVKLLDCTSGQGAELAEEASRKGWIVFKHVDDVIEVLFPNLMTEEEMEWLREQN